MSGLIVSHPTREAANTPRGLVTHCSFLSHCLVSRFFYRKQLIRSELNLGRKFASTACEKMSSCNSSKRHWCHGAANCAHESQWISSIIQVRGSSSTLHSMATPSSNRWCLRRRLARTPQTSMGTNFTSLPFRICCSFCSSPFRHTLWRFFSLGNGCACGTPFVNLHHYHQPAAWRDVALVNRLRHLYKYKVSASYLCFAVFLAHAGNYFCIVV